MLDANTAPRESNLFEWKHCFTTDIYKRQALEVETKLIFKSFVFLTGTIGKAVHNMTEYN